MTLPTPTQLPAQAPGCRWIDGLARGRAFDPNLYCEAETVPNKPYCAAHCKRAYVPSNPA